MTASDPKSTWRQYVAAQQATAKSGIRHADRDRGQYDGRTAGAVPRRASLEQEIQAARHRRPVQSVAADLLRPSVGVWAAMTSTRSLCSGAWRTCFPRCWPVVSIASRPGRPAPGGEKAGRFGGPSAEILQRHSHRVDAPYPSMPGFEVLDMGQASAGMSDLSCDLTVLDTGNCAAGTRAAFRFARTHAECRNEAGS